MWQVVSGIGLLQVIVFASVGTVPHGKVVAKLVGVALVPHDA
jgi:hypothetical protein